MTKAEELLALADVLLGDRYRMSGVALRSAAAALREYAGMLDAEPVAWLAAYVNSDGLPDKYVTTHHELAVENDANRSPKPLFFNPPAPSTQAPVAWMNVKYGTFFGAGVIAATDRNDDLIASGELVRLYTHPPAPTTPLTDAEIEELWFNVEAGEDVAAAKEFARAVLAAQEAKK